MAREMLGRGKRIEDPPLARKLLGDSRAGWLWLIPRVWLGYMWLEAGIGKLTNPAWTVTGEALKGFWTSAVAIPDTGRPAIAFAWYRAFLQFLLDSGTYTWFAKLIVAGELLIGIALVLGAFTGIAAFMGGFLNWNYMMAGSASVNPVYFVIAIALILAWKVAGAIGLDHFLLPLLGTPWSSAAEEKDTRSERGRRFGQERQPSNAGD
jgi:thiosulfate dehydrogenase [quinone] large subunit